jgi:hypothetical protein
VTSVATADANNTAKSNENSTIVAAAMENPTETESLVSTQNQNKAATSSVDHGKSNKNTTIIATAMENPTETPSSVTTENQKKAATSSVEDGTSNENAIIVDSSSDKEDEKNRQQKRQEEQPRKSFPSRVHRMKKTSILRPPKKDEWERWETGLYAQREFFLEQEKRNGTKKN